MQAALGNIANAVNGVLWSAPLIVLCVVGGIYFSFGLKFFQIRLLKDMLKLLVQGKSSDQGLSSFQAFSLAVGGRVGVGAIAGVATAIVYGGPGAVFWMWVITIFGAATTFVECSLAQLYKQEIDGEYRGGAAYYIEKGLKSKFLGAIYAISIIFASTFCLTGPQANTMSAGMRNAFGLDHRITGVVVVILLGICIFGGVKRLGRVSEIVIPIKCGAYILISLIVVLFNIKELPGAFVLIFSSAFGMKPIFAGIIGSAISMGVKRGIYSSEAGMGTATQSAAAAEVSHPAKQGLVQALSVYLDIIFVCSGTAFMILTTKSYYVLNANNDKIVDYIGNVEVGPGLVQHAVDTLIPIGSQFIAIAVLVFAFTVLMNMYYNCETNLTFFFRNGTPKAVTNGLRICYLACTLYYSVTSVEFAWAYGDIGIGLITWVNMIALVLIGRTAFKILKDYERQKALGIDPHFNPDAVGISGAELWKKKYEAYIQVNPEIR